MTHPAIFLVLFAAEIGGDFAPAVSVPFEDGIGDAVSGEPRVGTGEDGHKGGILGGGGDVCV